MDAKDRMSSEELTVFQTYADLVNSERATMWARHNAMLVANSLILSALAHQPNAQMAGYRPARRRTSNQRRLAGDYDRRVVGRTPSRDHRRNIRVILFRPLAEPLCPERLRRSAGQDLSADPGGDRRFRGDVSRARPRPFGRLKAAGQSAPP
jgi:hypothetical protein